MFIVRNISTPSFQMVGYSVNCASYDLRHLKERFRLSCKRYATFAGKIRRYRIEYGNHKPKYTYEERKHSLTIVLVKDRPLRTSLRSLPTRYAFSLLDCTDQLARRRNVFWPYVCTYSFFYSAFSTSCPRKFSFDP